MIGLMCAHVCEIGVWALYYGYAGVALRQGLHAVRIRLRELHRARLRRPGPAEGKRLIGPITALNGLLLIGWSVAIIFEVMRMAEVQVGRLDEKDES